MNIVVEAAGRLLGELAINLAQTWLFRRPPILLAVISLVLLASGGHAISAVGPLVGGGFLLLGLVSAGWAGRLALRGRTARGTWTR